jgi:phosphatidylinositol alpha-1,6-mannosyltransferase
MRILYVTRKYPPSTGGMENAAYELYMALSATNDIALVKWGGANKLLPVVYPLLLLQALWKSFTKRPDIIYLQDGLMGPLGLVLKVLLGRPTIMTIHGLEATYANPVYRAVVPPAIRHQSQLVAVSNETKQKVLEGLQGSNPSVIFNGLRDSFKTTATREQNLALIAQQTGINHEQLLSSKILHTNGRLVRRKGVLWFIDNVMPQLLASGQPVLYLVSGKGKDMEIIQAAVTEHKLEDSVKLLGRVSDELLQALYNTADLFIMPNIPIKNDMEGFGLVALEAASCGTMVIASKLEGIQDAIIDGQNGVLVGPGDVTGYITTIMRELGQRSISNEDVRNYTLTHYSWDETARQYIALMQTVAGKRR